MSAATLLFGKLRWIGSVLRSIDLVEIKYEFAT